MIQKNLDRRSSSQNGFDLTSPGVATLVRSVSKTATVQHLSLRIHVRHTLLPPPYCGHMHAF